MLTCHAIVAGTLELTPTAARKMQRYLMESQNVEANHAKEGIYLDKSARFQCRSPNQNPANMYNAATKYGGVPKHWVSTRLDRGLC